MTKKKPRTTRKSTRKITTNHHKLKIINYVLLFLVLALSATITSYYFLTPNKKATIQSKQKTTSIKENDKIFDTFKDEKLTHYIEPKEQNTNLSPIEKAFEEYTEELEKEYTHDTQKIIPPKKEEMITDKTISSDTRPKIAIVIDDVTMQSQVKNLHTIDYKVNLSFMPPTPQHTHSAQIAQNLPFHMVHFPMQANTFKYEEKNTLHIGDSYEKIENRVKQIKELYPKAQYTNNHTGSKFTADDDSMDKLFRALKKYDFIFLDSRTTANTVAKKYAQKYQVPYLARNVFLDNNLEYDYIQNQLKKAIQTAKRTGYAIAIGHPHSITVQVLRESKDLLKDLNIVYLPEIPRE